MTKDRKSATPPSLRFSLAAILALGVTTASAAPAVIELPGPRAFPESITSTPDGTLYVSSLASGGVFRVMPAIASATLDRARSLRQPLDLRAACRPKFEYAIGFGRARAEFSSGKLPQGL
ncbi:MAG TPA: hypothetical protein VFC11_07915 [Methylocella sp.]|nr:hypothetical protein [Methylocella sp.]